MGLLVFIQLLALPPGIAGQYLTEDALETLRCVREWTELCDIGGYPGWTVNVSPTEVTVDPYGFGKRVVTFKVTKSTPEALDLVATYSGLTVAATISIRGRRLTWTGVDVEVLVHGEVVEQVTTNLVRRERVSKLWTEAERRLVPGGACTLPTVGDPDEGPCINTGTGLPETIGIE
jgi:hypothetical protein